MAEMRDLNQLIDEMLMFTPKEHDLHRRLNAVKDSIPYTAPEAIMVRWHDVRDALVETACAETLAATGVDPTCEEELKMPRWSQHIRGIFTTQNTIDRTCVSTLMDFGRGLNFEAMGSELRLPAARLRDIFLQGSSTSEDEKVYLAELLNIPVTVVDEHNNQLL